MQPESMDADAREKKSRHLVGITPTAIWHAQLCHHARLYTGRTPVVIFHHDHPFDWSSAPDLHCLDSPGKDEHEMMHSNGGRAMQGKHPRMIGCLN